MRFRQKGLPKKNRNDSGREFKRVRRDKAKREQWRQGYKQFSIKYGWRRERRWARREINKQNWDGMVVNKVKHYCDPWDWD